MTDTVPRNWRKVDMESNVLICVDFSNIWFAWLIINVILKYIKILKKSVWNNGVTDIFDVDLKYQDMSNMFQEVEKGILTESMCYINWRWLVRTRDSSTDWNYKSK